MSVDLCFNELHGSDLFHPAMTVKSGMQHFTFAEIHTDMEDLPVTQKGDHIALFCLCFRNFIKTAPLRFLFISILDAEICIVIKLYAEFPAVELDDKSPAVKERVFSAVRCMSDEKIMV